ncbi:MAG: hypothetical protein ACE5EG_04755, partial [Thermoanaerobaculia bacterium]
RRAYTNFASALEDDPDLRFVFWGRDDGDSLGRINNHFRRRSLSEQVHYEGAYVVRREAGSGVPDPGWRSLVACLERARLAPNPWPVGGGSSRFEAYLCGSPTVHMGIDYERAREGGREHTLIEVPDLLVPTATAFDPGDYLRLCRRCLYEESFATRVQQEQLAVARKVGDAEAWWQQLLRCHATWLQETADAST